MRVAHPQHPLNNKIIKVLSREAGHWIIERPDGGQEKLPLGWVEAVSPIIAQATPAAEPWAGVTELLNLVKMIKRLRVQSPEEVDDGNLSRDADKQSTGEPNPGGDKNTGMGAISGAETGRIGANPGWDAGQAGRDTEGQP